HASGSHVPSSTGSTNREDELQLKVIEAGKQSEYAGGSYLTWSRAETRSNKAAIFLSCTLHVREEELIGLGLLLGGMRIIMVMGSAGISC
ncbi:hypothetical protein Tco_1578487, partial [Tanacetum coccineum]